MRREGRDLQRTRSTSCTSHGAMADTEVGFTMPACSDACKYTQKLKDDPQPLPTRVKKLGDDQHMCLSTA
jgi:hypothetical protein